MSETPARLCLLVTGGAGFIGSNLVRRLVREGRHRVVNLDKLSYAGNLDSLADIAGAPTYRFERADIADSRAIARIFAQHEPDALLNLAAETHVDRSIDGPQAFIQTNVVGTGVLLDAARDHLRGRRGARAGAALGEGGFRFLQVSTDEVFGALGPVGRFSAGSPYRPSSPYAASKAAADHLVRAYGRTYGLPTILTNCTNNYGAHQFPEKLIPLVILKALEGRAIPVYGDGLQVRDWLHVEDHVEGLLAALFKGVPGETYVFGGEAERTNLAVVEMICAIMDRLRPAGAPHRRLIEHVADRPGHDRRYAMDIGRTTAALGWRPTMRFEAGLESTVRWYLDNLVWCRRVQDGSYRGERLGLLA